MKSHGSKSGPEDTTEDETDLQGLLPPLPAGHRIAGFTIDGVLGRGGMGVVYAARDAAGAKVALKVMKPSVDVGRRERFVREWHALLRLEHPGIVRVLDAGDSESGPWMALELVEGRPLVAVSMPLPLPRALEVAAAIAHAIDHAHRRGIVHRDLKPSNVLVARDGSIKVADFGLAKDLDARVALTALGEAIGTPTYMAPEQVHARPDAIGVAVDIHAIGVILYQLVTGDPPWKGDSKKVLTQVLGAEPEPPTKRRPDLGLPRGLDAVVARALEKAPRDRYLTAHEFALDLAHLARGEKPRHCHAKRAPTDPALVLGPDDNLGRYVIRYPVEHGASAVVFKAAAPDGAPVALKVLRDASAEQRQRYAREVRLLALVAEEEPGFVPLLDHGVAAVGPWLAMPFLTGGTLRDRLERKRFELDEAITLAASLAAIMGRAHARGVAHRDLKPENVLFDETGAPRVADLGLAHHFRRDMKGGSDSVTVSREGRWVGTAGYAAPEQLEDPRLAGPAADVFALGAILYECASGRPVFRADNPVTLIRKLAAVEHEPLAAVMKDVPRWLDALVEKALRLDPRKRWRDGAELAAALEARGARRGVLERVREKLEGVKKTRRKHEGA